MDDLQKLVDYIKRYILITEEEEKFLRSKAQVRKIRKKQFIAQPGFICRYRTYIVAGTMRSYFVNDDGQEHTVAFGIDDWWIADFNSYFFQQPATLFVEAMENSIVVQIEYGDEQELLEKFPRYEKFYRILSQNGYAYLQRRILSDISLNAEQRYEDFLQKYPAIVSRVPQYALASYLGISHELLSRIRNRRAGKS